MNACKAIELALKDTLAKFAKCGESTWLCAEQAQTKDADFEERTKANRFFPCVVIMATPESADDNGWTFAQPVRLLIGTHSSDDPFATNRAEIYEAVRGLVNALYFQALDPSIAPQTELDFFAQAFSGYLSGGTIAIGGITLPGNPAPGIVGEIQTMTVELVFHWPQTYTPTTTPQG
jgi:hypothetical protein